MKLDIEALSREAANKASTDYAKAVDDGGVISWESAKMYNFARLIVERCAEECEKEKLEFQAGAARNDGRQSDMAFGSVNSAERIAAAIRNLLED